MGRGGALFSVPGLPSVHLEQKAEAPTRQWACPSCSRLHCPVGGEGPPTPAPYLKGPAPCPERHPGQLPCRAASPQLVPHLPAGSQALVRNGKHEQPWGGRRLCRKPDEGGRARWGSGQSRGPSTSWADAEVHLQRAGQARRAQHRSDRLGQRQHLSRGFLEAEEGPWSGAESHSSCAGAEERPEPAPPLPPSPPQAAPLRVRLGKASANHTGRGAENTGDGGGLLLHCPPQPGRQSPPSSHSHPGGSRFLRPPTPAAPR